jgi:hypothetical protein
MGRRAGPAKRVMWFVHLEMRGCSHFFGGVSNLFETLARGRRLNDGLMWCRLRERLCCHQIRVDGALVDLLFAGFGGEGALFVLAVPEEAADDFGGEEAFELLRLSAEGGDLFDEGGGGEAEVFTGHDEDGFDGGDFAVGERDAEFVVEVGEIAEAAEYGGGLAFFDELNRKAFVGLDGDVGEAAGEGAEEREAFVDGEEELLFGIDADGDDEAVEELSAAVNDVDMTKCGGIESARVDGNFVAGGGHVDLAEDAKRGVQPRDGEECRGIGKGGARRGLKNLAELD